jgi:hypothetical protein
VVRRSIKLPFFDAFNGPDTISSCAGRDSTVVASQPLSLLNSADTLTCARALAGRLWTQSGGDFPKAAGIGWRALFCRDLTGPERERAAVFLQARETAWTQQPPSADALPTGLAPETPLPSPPRGAAWVEWCLALLNTNEFVYVD